MEDDHQLPPDYTETVELISARVSNTRGRVQLAANAHLIHLYWAIGSVLLERSKQSGWGSRVLPRLAEDLRRRFPTMKGFSATNLKYMRQLAAAWPEERSLGQQAVDQLPWGHITLLFGVDARERQWYIDQAVQHGWSRSLLSHNVRNRLAGRTGAANTNFGRLLDPEGADLAQHVTRDPYVLDFLALDGDRDERAMESAMVDRIAETLRELGTGFAFVGRQMQFDVDGNDFFVDLLFFHVEQLRYVVVELKRGDFCPEHVGQLSFYVALVDDRLRLPTHADTVGLLLVAGKSDAVVRYALGTSTAPVGVASYDLLPPEVQRALPSEADLRRALSGSENERS
ncbi:YhcG family protein [Curtobacterium sp. NPDC090217]|uniref:PDDEXK nuclease domain-containing protein n=1 Tax=Curtobacterium sp. NPDC090217 TaxID=3363970 RepID=UPI00382DBE70